MNTSRRQYVSLLGLLYQNTADWWLKPQRSFSQFRRTGSEIRAPARAGSGGSSHLGWQSSYCLHVVTVKGVRGFILLLIKSFHCEGPTLMNSSKPSYLPKAQTSHPITWGLESQHVNFGGYIQSITPYNIIFLESESLDHI